MVGEISASHALSKEVVEGVNQRTGGVPLFVEEVTRLLLERGEQGGVQTIPPTLQQSLAARLDRLGPAREVAQIGAVLGRDFAYTLLRDITDLDEPALQASLDRLADADLLFVEGAPPQASYRFKHALIQDAAYDSLLKSRRQALHRRAAELLRDDPERGEICVKGPNVMKGYWKKPEATANSMTADGFFRTGDVGVMDEDGYVYIVDRTKDMLLCGGFNLYPRNIEEAIYQHPSVEEVSVIGVPDEYRGETPKAFVKLKAGASLLTLEEIKAFLKDRLGKHEMIGAIEIRDELPKTPVGKISKKDLRESQARAHAEA
jgi:hypothetical protein